MRTIAMAVLRDAIRVVVAEKEAEYDGEGDAWLFHPNPDEAYLRVDALTDALTDLIAGLS